MRWILYTVAAIALVIVVVIGGTFAWFANVKTDVKDPNFAAKFQEILEGSCVQRVKGGMAGGGALDYQQEAIVKQVCACDVKAVMKILAKKNATNPIDMQQALNDSGEEANAAFDSCAAAYGVQ